MSEIMSRLDAIKERALNGGLPLARKDIKLYQVLADWLTLCEDVERDGLVDELRESIRVTTVDKRDPAIWGQVRAAGNQGRGRRYSRKDSDVHVVVCRYALEGPNSSRSYYRYAISLREASLSQIRGDQLVEWLTNNGGVSSLFLSRKLKRRSLTTKILNLTSSIVAPKDEPFTITLQYNGRGQYHVIKNS